MYGWPNRARASLRSAGMWLFACLKAPAGSPVQGHLPCVFVCLCISVALFGCLCICVYMYVSTCLCMCVCVSVCECLYLSVSVYASTHNYVCVISVPETKGLRCWREKTRDWNFRSAYYSVPHTYKSPPVILQSVAMGSIVLYLWGNWGSERWHYLLMVTQLLSLPSELEHFALTQDSHLWPCVHLPYIQPDICLFRKITSVLQHWCSVLTWSWHKD